MWKYRFVSALNEGFIFPPPGSLAFDRSQSFLSSHSIQIRCRYTIMISHIKDWPEGTTHIPFNQFRAGQDQEPHREGGVSKWTQFSSLFFRYQHSRRRKGGKSVAIAKVQGWSNSNCRIPKVCVCCTAKMHKMVQAEGLGGETRELSPD